MYHIIHVSLFLECAANNGLWRNCFRDTNCIALYFIVEQQLASLMLTHL